MIEFEKVTDVNYTILYYGVNIGSLGINKFSARLYLGEIDMMLPKTSKPVLKELIMANFSNEMQVRLNKYCYNNENISIKQCKQILNR